MTVRDIPKGQLVPCLLHNLHLPTLGALTMGHCVGENWASQAQALPPLSQARWGTQAGRGKEATELEVATSLFVRELSAMCSVLLKSRWQEFQEQRGVSL